MSEIETYIEQITPVTFANTTTTNAQQAAQTAALTGGGFVVVWQDGSAAGPSRDIRGQMFDANGAKVGGEFLIDQSVGTAQTRVPSVAATANGGFVVAWSDTTTGIMARAFDQAGTALGSQFGVQATTVSAPAVSIASMSDGHYMIGWQELVAASGNVPAHYILMGNVYDATNASLTGAFSIYPTGDAQGSPTVAAVGNEFVVSWTNTPLADLDSEIMAQRFGATGGALGGAIHVNTVTTGTQNTPSVAALADGSFVVAYTSTATSASGDSTVAFQRIDHDGNKLGGELTINGPVGREFLVKAIGLQDGNFIIGWNHRYTATDGSSDYPADIYAQEFRADGTPMGAAIGYGTMPSPNSQLTVQSGEGVQYTILNSGHIVTTWTDNYSIENYSALNDRVGIQMIIGDPLTLLFGDGTANTLTATDHSTAIEGYDGDDTLTGGAGKDQISGGAGNDTIHGGAGNDTIYGSEGNDTIFGDAGNDTIDGGDGDDRIDGGAGSDTLYGGAGNDTLIDSNQGSANSSAIYGEDGDDILLVGTGWYHVDGGAGNDRLTANYIAVNSTLSGGDGNDVITINGMLGFASGTVFVDGGAGDDAITLTNVFQTNVNAGDGNDTIRLNGSSAYIILGNGQDLLIAGTTASNATVNQFVAGEAGDRLDLSIFGSDPFGAEGRLTMANVSGGVQITDSMSSFRLYLGLTTVNQLSAYNLGAANSQYNPQGMTLDGVFAERPDIAWQDYLVGADGNDLIRGYAGDDTLYGAGGNDRLDGGTGNDAMYGGTGDDTYVVDSLDDVVVENANAGTDTVESSIGCTLGDNVENLTLTGTADIDGVGNSGNNVIVGNGGNNHLSGGGGTDTLTGGAGNDTYTVDSADDLVVENAGEGTDVVKAVVDYSIATQFNIELLRLSGTDNINATGNTDAQKLVGNSGDNVLDGGGGGDVMRGGAGNDTYIVRHATDRIVEGDGKGDDTAKAAVSYTLGGAASVEHLLTIDANATTAINLTGNDYSHDIQGNAGANVLSGGTGDDVIQGFGGNDTLIGGSGADRFVFGHRTGQDSVGDFVSGTDKLDLAAFGFASFAAVQAATHDVGGNAVIDLGGGDSVTLSGVLTAQLQSGDVILGGSGQAPLPPKASVQIDFAIKHDSLGHQFNHAGLIAPHAFALEHAL